MYFKLFSNCFITEGYKNAIIVDVHKSSYVVISKKLIDLLDELKRKSLEQVEAENPESAISKLRNLLTTLKNDNLGFFTSNPQYFPDIDLHWYSNSVITNSVICVNGCSINKLADMLLELDHVNCKDFQIRIEEDVTFSQLNSQLSVIGKSKIKNIELFIPFGLKNNIKDLLRLHYRIVRILIYNSPYKKRIKNITYIKEESINEIQCGCINTNNFTANLRFYSESQCYNTCLNRKISIDNQGYVRNCPSMKIHYGNISENKIINVIRNPEFRKWWYFIKDDIDVCKDCEFRHICTDCRVFVKESDNLNSQPYNCSYNPYIGIWEGHENWLSVEQWRKENLNWEANIKRINNTEINIAKQKEEDEYFNNGHF